MSDSILDNPYQFARKWYDADGIHRCINAKHQLPGNDHDKIPPDPSSIEFARWLSEQYVLAMCKGATLAIEEMRQAARKTEA